MSLEGTNIPAITPVNTNNNSVAAPDNTTPGRNIVFEPAIITGSPSTESSVAANTQPNPINNNDATSASSPNASIVDIQEPLEITVPVDQSSRSESSSPTSQDTRATIQSHLAMPSQDDRGIMIAPQLQTAAPSTFPTITDSPIPEQTKNIPVIQSAQPEKQNSSSQETRVMSYPAYGQPPLFPTEDNNDSNAYGVRTMWTTIPYDSTLEKPKAKKKKSQKKSKAKKKAPTVIDVPSKQKPMPMSEEEEAADSMRKLNKKFSEFERNNPGKPIPLTRDDLETVLLFDYLNLLKNSWVSVNRINADGYFFLDPAREYMISKQIGDIPPGIYKSSDINYVYQGLVSAMDGRTNSGDSAIIGGYNAAQGLPGFFTGDIDSIEHNFNQMEIGPAFAKIGFDFGMNYNNTHE